MQTHHQIDDLDDEWESFCNTTDYNYNNYKKMDDLNSEGSTSEDDYMKYDTLDTIESLDSSNMNLNDTNNEIVPKCSDIYISTKTKIAYLSKPIDLKSTFWNIPVSLYHTRNDCVIKKQMKFNFINEDELTVVKEYLTKETYYEEYIITRIVNPEGRIKFKDIRKISIGICKKDILSFRTKKKSAFYNCFVVILRIKLDDVYREIHVKVFNTGKLEIPGIQNNTLLEKVLDLLLIVLKPIVGDDLDYNKSKTETVLINSNFNCGFYINREKLFNLLKYKYHINSSYDPCSYPGIQSKCYFNKQNDEFVHVNSNNIEDKQSINLKNVSNNIDDKIYNSDEDNNIITNNIIKISFMIFRTGSVLIVGKCNEELLNKVYLFIKNMLFNEYNQIKSGIINDNYINKNKDIKNQQLKKRKNRKKFIIMS
jgi:TATA-box binding protein (TBP) (component of TFIID and TFIIIB)